MNEIPEDAAGEIVTIPNMGGDVAAVAALNRKLLSHGGHATSWDFDVGGAGRSPGALPGVRERGAAVPGDRCCVGCGPHGPHAVMTVPRVTRREWSAVTRR